MLENNTKELGMMKQDKVLNGLTKKLDLKLEQAKTLLNKAA